MPPRPAAPPTVHAVEPGPEGEPYRAAGRRLVAAASAAIGRPAFSEQAMAPLLRADPAAGAGPQPGATSLAAVHGEQVTGWAELLPGHRAWAVEVAADLALDPPGQDAATLALLDTAREAATASGASLLHWWVHQPGDQHDELARQAGFRPSRDLHQLKRPLPVPDPAPILPTRSFRPGVDDEAWLAVNNRAFAWHAEQGGWEQAQLAQHLAEPWFDVDDFRVYDDPDTGRLAAFCWTKVHADLDPVEGEIYVIGVDPDFTGRGLGRQLTLAGLDSLHHRHGITVGMLYVDGTNTAARTLYDHLGFATAALDRAYVHVP